MFKGLFRANKERSEALTIKFGCALVLSLDSEQSYLTANIKINLILLISVF